MSDEGKYDEATYVDDKGNRIVVRKKKKSFWKKFAQAMAERQEELKLQNAEWEWEEGNGKRWDTDSGLQPIDVYCKFCKMKTVHLAKRGKKKCLNCGLISFLT